MKKTLNWLFAMALAASSLALAGCAAQGAQTPTTDPVVIYTQVAQTVQAQVTSNAKLTPKATETAAPTETLAATSTLRPTSTPFGTQAPTSATKSATPSSGTVLPGLKTGTPGAILPTTTVAVDATQVPVAGADKMQYISQSIADGTSFNQNEGFTQSWLLKNVGTTTWDNTYLVRFYAGDRFSGKDGPIGVTVKPGAQGKITVEMIAPNTRGEYTSVWVITNPDGRNFGSFTLTIKVR